MAADEAHLEMLLETNKLARQMVYLEDAACEAYRRKLWTIVGELHDQRDEVQAYRSEMLRLVWQHQRRQRWRRGLE